MLRSVAIALLATFALATAAAAEAKLRNGPIFYTDGGDLFKVRPDGTNTRVVGRTFYYDSFTISANGGFTGVLSGLALLDLSDGTLIRRLSSDSWDGAPAWSPDGRELAFQHCERTIFTDIEECVKWGIYRRRLDGSHLRRVAEGTGPNWSADGRSIVFLHTQKRPDSAGNRCNGIYLVGADGKGLRRVLPRSNGCTRTFLFPAEPSPAPDGRRIVFMLGAQDDPNAGIWTVRTDGSAPRHIVRVPRDRFTDHPRWSPDGRLIAYALLDKNYRGGLYVARPTGAKPHRIVRFAHGGDDIAWQPLRSRR